KGISNALAISSGGNSSCALLAGKDGVRCWGDNSFGKLGNGLNSEQQVFSATPVTVGNDDSNTVNTSQVQMALGVQHSCVLNNQGQVQCWGDNQYGQLGNGSTNGSTIPVLVNNLAGVVQLSSHGNHNCALNKQAKLACWGDNQSGQLGDGSDINRTSPVSITLEASTAKLSGLATTVTQVATSRHHSCALLSSGQVACWGSNDYGELGHQDEERAFQPTVVPGISAVQAITVGDGMSCATRIGGQVYCWGSIAGEQIEQPRLMDFNADDLAKLNVSGEHFCQLTGGGVFCTGRNHFGQLGNNSYEDSSEAVAVVELAGVVQHLDVGGNHSCAILDSGLIQCWGDNTYGQLGVNSDLLADSPIPVTMNADNNTTIQPMPVATGKRHSCLLTENNTVRCWGENKHGQLGDGDVQSRLSPSLDVSGLDNPVVALSASGNSSCAIDDSGAAYCWGENSNGQLGNGRLVDSPVASPVAGLDGGVTKLAQTGNTACAIVNGSVYCWGSNASSQLADPGLQQSQVPVAISSLNNGVIDLAMTDFEACALINTLTTKGWVKCWGHDKDAPTTVVGADKNITQLSAGDKHLCVQRNDGQVLCWGDNQFGQLGSSISTHRNNVLEVSDLPAQALQLSSGANHSCALLSNDSVMCWGAGEVGQLGNGQSLNSSTPVSVQGLPAEIVAINGADNHSCAYIADNSVYCWGENQQGQLGNGLQQNSNVAVLVLKSESINLSDIFTNQQLSASSHTCQLNAGQLSCWGNNDQGQSGKG
ncbi:RCC1 domain-containing protein, partial [Candidatus Venteria ishoeyi]|uniref:RCC1 domain-containing protein n=1 Tax=Candidatus Venteria ishoeyi TaxID=1899563 RepID=UPI000CDE8CDF